jgi:hypothetical protein
MDHVKYITHANTKPHKFVNIRPKFVKYILHIKTK